MCEGERLNFYRLSLLIMDGGTPTLKWLFKKQYAASGDLEIFLKSMTTVVDGLHQRKIINPRQMDLLRPSTGIKPSVEKFDISLLITLLTNICSIQQPQGGWTVSPATIDLCTAADILRVRDARNNLFHHAKCGINDADFQLESSNVSAAISRLSNQLDKQQQENIQKIINDATHAAIDCGREREICNLIFADTMEEMHYMVKTMYDRGNNGVIAGLPVPKASCSLLKDEKHDGTKDQPNIDIRFTLGENSIIFVVKLYADLKKELTREIVMSIAKTLLKEDNSTAELEEIERASSTRLCIDSLLKRVIHRGAATVQSFLTEIKSKCPRMANLLAKTIITDEDHKKFQLIDDRVQTRGMSCSRVHTQFRIDEADVKFFQRHLHYLPENVDQIADALLSKFYMSFFDHSKVILHSDVFAKIHILFETIQSCPLDSVSELECILGSELYKKWIECRNNNSGPNGENTGIWQSIIQQISGAAPSLMESICQTFDIVFIRSERGSLVLIFEAGDNFNIELLKPESVKKKVRELLEKTCPEHHPLFKDPIHVTIYVKSAKYGDKEEIHFILETTQDRKEIEDAHSHFGRHDRDYVIQKMDPTPLKQWMFERLKIDECTQIHLEEFISWNVIGRGERMRILIDTLERFEDGYELLQRYCEENDKFVYEKVFKKEQHSRADHKTEAGYDREGMQKLFTTWIDFSEDPTGSRNESEILVSDEMKLSGIDESAIQISHGNPIEQSVEENLSQEGIMMSTEERDLFVKFQNEIGTDIYFSKGPYMLIDGQETIKATERFIEQSQPDIKDKWLEYKSQGKLTPELTHVICAEERNKQLHDKKEFFLNKMEQLNIIVKAMAFNENGLMKENYFFVLCMLSKESPREVFTLETDAHIVSTPVLCWVFKGTSTLLEIFQKLIAACLARWPVAKKKKTSEHLIFKHCAVFDLDLIHRLFLQCDNHAVFARITGMGIDQINAKMCTRVRKFITLNLSHQDPNLKYQLRVQNIESQDTSEHFGSRFSPSFEMWFVEEVHDQTSPITREQMNHARLCVAIIAICGKAMRTILVASPPAPHTSIYQAILANKTKLMSRTQDGSGKWKRAHLNKDQRKILFPDPRLGVSSIDMFDIPLLYTLIKHISSVKPPSTAWGVCPQDMPRDKSLGANVERIHLYRNEICGHSVDGQISQQDFEDYWNKIDSVLHDIDVIVGQSFRQELEKQRTQVISVYEAY